MSAYAVEISPDAFEDLRAIQTYISRELGSPAAAARTVRQILETIGRLERFPLRNGVLATLPDGRVLRQAKAENYLALYVTTDSTVSVLAVIYGRSDVEKRLTGLF